MPKVFRLFSLSCFISFSYANNKPENFLFIGGNADNLASYQAKISRPEIQGVQIIYSWKRLEPQKDHYNFDLIESNLN